MLSNIFLALVFFRKYHYRTTRRDLHVTSENVSAVTVIQFNVDGSKICYQCDDKHPSPWWKFWGEKISRCKRISFEKYATKTSKAFGAAVLTCYTVLLFACHVRTFLAHRFFSSCRNSTKQETLSKGMPTDSVKHSIKLSNVEIVIIPVVRGIYATSIPKHLVHQHVRTCYVDRSACSR
jgi:hypothetical protein